MSKQLWGDYIETDTLYANTAVIAEATITDLNSTVGIISNLASDTATVTTLNSTTAAITTGNIGTLNSTTGTVITLNSTTGTITTGNIGTLNSTTGNVETLNSTTGTITTGNIGILNSTTGIVTTLNSTTGTITTGNIGTLNSTTGTVTTLNSTIGTITTGNIGTLNSTTGTITTLNNTTLNTSALNLSGNFTWSNVTGAQQPKILSTSSATAVTMFDAFAGRVFFVGTGGTISGSPLTFNFNVADTGAYEISVEFLASAATTAVSMTFACAVDGFSLVNRQLPVVNPALSYQGFNWRRVRVLTVGAHTLLPTFLSSTAGTQVHIRELSIIVRRLSNQVILPSN